MSHDDNIAELEKEKYLKVWQHDAYRDHSPGVLEQARALKIFAKFDCQTVADYGCGEGKSVRYFKLMLQDAFGIEHAPNAVRAKGIVVYEECLWQLHHTPDSDAAFCCDVMEHIPALKVNLVLHQIRAKTRKVAYFRIATVEDYFGPKLINKPLHLTVRTPSEWEATLQRHWGYVERIATTDNYVVFACLPTPPDELFDGSRDEVGSGDQHAVPHDHLTRVGSNPEAEYSVIDDEFEPEDDDRKG